MAFREPIINDNLEEESISKVSDLVKTRIALGLPEDSQYKELVGTVVESDGNLVDEYLENKRNLVSRDLDIEDNYLDAIKYRGIPEGNKKNLNPLRWHRKRKLLKKSEKMNLDIQPILGFFEKKYQDPKCQELLDDETIVNLAELSSKLTEPEFIEVIKKIGTLNLSSNIISPWSFKSTEFTNIFISLGQVDIKDVEDITQELNKYVTLYQTTKLFEYDSSELTKDAKIRFNMVLNGSVPDQYKALLKKVEKCSMFSASGLLPVTSENLVKNELVTFESITSPEAIFFKPEFTMVIDHLVSKQLLENDGEGRPKLPSYLYETLLELNNSGELITLNYIIESGVDVTNFLFANERDYLASDNHLETADRLKQVKSTLDDPEKREWMELFHELQGFSRLDFFEIGRLEELYENREEIKGFIEIFNKINNLLDTNKVSIRDLFRFKDVSSDGNRRIEFNSDLIAEGLINIINTTDVDSNIYKYIRFFSKNALVREHRYSKPELVDLPLQGYLLDNIDNFSENVFYGRPTASFLEAIARGDTDIPEERVVDWLNNSDNNTDVSPELLLRYFKNLNNSLMINIANKYESDELLSMGLPEKYAPILSYISKLDHDIQIIFKDHDGDLEEYFVNDLPSHLFFEYILENDNGNNIDFSDLLTQDLLSTFSTLKEQYWSQYRDGSKIVQVLLKNNRTEIEDLLTTHSSNPEKFISYISVVTRISNSPSQELQRLREGIVKQLLQVDNPVEKYDKIEDIFVSNNLPTVGKIYKVFLILHPEDEFSRKLDKGSDLSPVLKSADSKQREAIVFRDLINITIKNNNKSLKNYLEFFQSNGILLQKFEELGWSSLATEEQNSLIVLLNKSSTLQNSVDGLPSVNTKSIDELASGEEIQNLISQFKESFNVSQSELLSEGIINFFTKDLGYSSISEILNIMDTERSNANERGLENAQLAVNGNIGLEEGDLIKAIDAKYFVPITRNGNLAQEFLGASAGSDSTPFDTDVSRVISNNLVNDETGNIKSNKEIIDGTPSGGSAYGEMKLIFKDRGQFSKTNQESVIDQNDILNTDKYELFPAVILDDETHYGIRTGIPFTEVDFIYVEDSLLNNEKKMKNIFFTIAENNYYIPVLDGEDNLIFTPEMFQQYRKIFAGIPEFSDEKLEITEISDDSAFSGEITQLRESSVENFKRIENLQKNLRSTIKQVLEEFNIPLQGLYSQHLLEAELHDTGSTGRYTNLAGDSDFDLLIRLDNESFKKVPQLQARLIEILNPTDYDANSRDGNTLVKMNKTTGVTDDELVDVDIFFVQKSNVKEFATYDAVMHKLSSIKESYGEETYHQVIANILLTKKMLKKANAYKKMDGGFGGVGVENWILQHNGNIESAFSSFWEAAHQDNEEVSLEEFKNGYPLLDPGLDLVANSHDNFIEFLSESAYKNILELIKSNRPK